MPILSLVGEKKDDETNELISVSIFISFVAHSGWRLNTRYEYKESGV